ncbi:MAG: LPS export ABC transporter periplasmic protein LptC [Bacteroidia bacterium]|nr:LPS export ABC transporter periplasmic protein LptC [Bacteroidales bacterium]NCD00421.1 LPS export ABC transporter periplasmic protein LptC [Bacteroidia bacterium]MDD2322746.1 LPS export ABC transporter periplasmic protein LptC [Bacteroidales bacterium]MDD3009909.1 LPS export ABC transporter periplasmic protein LptC [Bacteroidales bacterium]MDD3960393.1 LPS export ABC transporter periplasmic protein LptC [Bacteroidales bacterium]
MAKTWIWILSCLFLLVYLLFSGCSNNMETVKEMTLPRDTTPTESAFNVTMHYSEQGRIQFTLTAPRLDRFSTNSPFVEFPEGLHVVFFDSTGIVKSELSANYAISYESKKIMEAREDVVVVNHEKEQTLNTEHLTWDQKKHIIFSDEFVKITTKEHVIFGNDGFESDEEFNKWTIRKISGTLDIES